MSSELEINYETISLNCPHEALDIEQLVQITELRDIYRTGGSLYKPESVFLCHVAKKYKLIAAHQLIRKLCNPQNRPESLSAPSLEWAIARTQANNRFWTIPANGNNMRNLRLLWLDMLIEGRSTIVYTYEDYQDYYSL